MDNPTLAPVRPSARFMLSHPAHFVALGFGSGLSPVAPGTAGTLWAWAAFVALQPWMNDLRWAVLIALSLLVGWWVSTVTAKNMRVLDPSGLLAGALAHHPGGVLGATGRFCLVPIF
jgi:phosphatidylglycerophosphatase A